MSDTREETCLTCFGSGRPFGEGFSVCCDTCNGHGFLMETKRWSLSKRKWVFDYERLDKKVGKISSWIKQWKKNTKEH